MKDIPKAIAVLSTELYYGLEAARAEDCDFRRFNIEDFPTGEVVNKKQVFSIRVSFKTDFVDALEVRMCYCEETGYLTVIRAVRSVNKRALKKKISLRILTERPRVVLEGALWLKAMTILSRQQLITAFTQKSNE